jgi:Uncharacterised nucleotidyltransferase
MTGARTGSLQPSAELPVLELLASAVRGQTPAWPPESPQILDADVLRVAAEQGVTALVGARASTLATWPVGVRDRLSQITRDACVIEAIREREMGLMLTALDDAGVSPLVTKGTALAYTLYDAAHLRSRVDTDLLVPRDDVPRAIQALEAIGYLPTMQNVGELVSHQIAMARVDAHGVWHAVDVHWKVANPHVFADLLPVDELVAWAVPVPRLGPLARAPGPAHALLLSSVHLAAHHANHPRLIWLYDLHLLCGRLTTAEFDQAAACAESRGLAAVCAQSLHLARRWFDTSVPGGVLARLQSVDAATERPARYVVESVGKLGTLISDLQTLPSWGARAQLVYEHLFPPADYMLRRYGTTRRSRLPALYIHRVVTGGWRWIRQA